MKRIVLSLFFAALSTFCFAQKFDLVNAAELPDGRYSELNGDVRISGWVLNGQKTGSWIESHPKSEIPHYVREYKEGNLSGISLDINKQGEVTKQAEYINGQLDGVVYRWSKGGRLVDEVSYKNGQKDGISKIYYDKGTLQEESFYKEGKRDGVTIWYAYNDKSQGPKVASYTYKAGQFEGLQETYYEDGTVKTSKIFAKNVQHGLAVEYYEDGSVKSETNYKKGEISGKVKEYEMGKKVN